MTRSPFAATFGAPHRMLYALGRNWGLLLVRGLCAILFGILAFVVPGLTVLALLMMYAAYALVDGVLSIVAAVKGGTPAPRWWLAVVGVLGIAAAVLTFLLPGMTALVLLYVIAGWAIATGVMQIVGAMRLRKEIDDEFYLVLSGLLSVAVGVLLITRPGAGALAMVLIIGAWAVAHGLLLVFFSLRVHRYAKHAAAIP